MIYEYISTSCNRTFHSNHSSGNGTNTHVVEGNTNNFQILQKITSLNVVSVVSLNTCSIYRRGEFSTVPE